MVARQTAPGAGTLEGIFDLHSQGGLPMGDYQAVAQNEEALERLLEGHSARRLAVARTTASVIGFPDDLMPMYSAWLSRRRNGFLDDGMRIGPNDTTFRIMMEFATSSSPG